MTIAKVGWELTEVLISLWKVRDCTLAFMKIAAEFFFEADLHQIIKSGQTLSSEHIQYFVYQILRGISLPASFVLNHLRTNPIIRHEIHSLRSENASVPTSGSIA